MRCKKFKMYLVKSKLPGRHEDGKNFSSKKLQIKTNPDNATDNIKGKYYLKCDAISNTFTLFAA